MTFNRKHVVLGALVILLAVAGYLNWSYNSKNLGAAEAQNKVLGEAAYVNNDVKMPENDYFASSRIDREKARAESKQILSEIIDNPNTDADGKKKAQDAMIALAKAVTDESACETLLKNKGFQDVLVTINEDKMTISVKAAEELLPNQVAQIQEVATANTDFKGEQIKIMRTN